MIEFYGRCVALAKFVMNAIVFGTANRYYTTSIDDANVVFGCTYLAMNTTQRTGNAIYTISNGIIYAAVIILFLLFGSQVCLVMSVAMHILQTLQR